MQKINKGETITFNRCVKKELKVGVVEAVLNKGTPQEAYAVRMDDKQIIVHPMDVESSMISFRIKKSTKPKIKKNCGCK